MERSRLIEQCEKLKEIQSLRILDSNFMSDLLYLYKTVLAVFERCPYKKGTRVALTETPHISPESGWYSAKHFLIEGAKATVHEVGFSESKGLYAYLAFDDDSWIDYKGVLQYTRVDKPLYWFCPNSFKMLEEDEECHEKNQKSKSKVKKMNPTMWRRRSNERRRRRSGTSVTISS